MSPRGLKNVLTPEPYCEREMAVAISLSHWRSFDRQGCAGRLPYRSYLGGTQSNLWTWIPPYVVNRAFDFTIYSIPDESFKYRILIGLFFQVRHCLNGYKISSRGAR